MFSQSIREEIIEFWIDILDAGTEIFWVTVLEFTLYLARIKTYNDFRIRIEYEDSGIPQMFIKPGADIDDHLFYFKYHEILLSKYLAYITIQILLRTLVTIVLYFAFKVIAINTL